MKMKRSCMPQGRSIKALTTIKKNTWEHMVVSSFGDNKSMEKFDEVKGIHITANTEYYNTTKLHFLNRL
jgi:hypothetical protein